MLLDAKPRTIITLFNDPNDLLYKIPMYQRAYSWKREEVKNFCDDLDSLYSEATKDYFFGALITMSEKNNENIQEIIDGQQRITTFTILISQLYNLCEELIEEMSAKNDYKLRYKEKIKGLRTEQSNLGQCLKYNDNYKVTLSKIDKEYFKTMLDISSEYELITLSYKLIENIEEIESIKTDRDMLEKYIKTLDKTLKGSEYEYLLKVSDIYTNIKYDDLCKEYINLCINKFNCNSRYDKKRLEKNLLMKYINDRLNQNKKTIDRYIGEDSVYISNQDILSLEKMLNFEKEKLDSISHNNLRDSYRIINENIIKSIVDIKELDERVDKLRKFIDLFIHKTYVVKISSTNKDSVYTMFQVLNDRSKPLGIIELLRPYTLQLLEGEGNEDKQKEMGCFWDKLAEDKNCETYMKIYILSYKNISRSEKKIHNKYKEIFFNHEKMTENDIYENVKKICYMKEIYSKILEGEWPYQNSKIDYYTKYRFKQIIKTLRYDACIPLIIAIYELDKNNEDNLIYAIDIIERVVFRYITICGNKATKLTEVYKNTIKDIREYNKFDRLKFKYSMNELLKNADCKIDKFKEKIDCDRLQYKDNGSNKVIKYFLSTIEYYYQDYYEIYSPKTSKKILDRPSKSLILNQEAIEIEHIYPRKSKLAISDMEDIKNCIGNLTLLEKLLNIDASNNDFNVKQKEYSKESIRITKLLDGIQVTPNSNKTVKKWDIDEYKKRLDLYTDIASKIYTLDGE